MERQMIERSIWDELNATPEGELGVIYDDGIALIDDGVHLWIADAAKFRDTIAWARVTPADSHFAHEAYASFWGHCRGFIVTDIGEGDRFTLDIDACIHALSECGYYHLIPSFWLAPKAVEI